MDAVQESRAMLGALSYPVPSISWRKGSFPYSKVHFAWEFGAGGTACGAHILRGSIVNRDTNRQITCQKCLLTIYGIPLHSPKQNLFLEKIMKNNDDLIKLIWKEVDRLGSQKKVAEAIGVTPGFLGDILHGRTPVTDQVASYFGYTKVTGFVKDAES